MTAVDLGDIQGLVARGYGRLKAARFVLVRITEPAVARAWLRRLGPSVTTALDDPSDQALNVAFTASGLERLGLPATILRQFSYEFVTGMTPEHRRRVLGDSGESAPEHWLWGGPASPDVDGVVLVYGADQRQVDLLHEATLGDLTAAGLVEVRRLESSPLGYTEHFGFVDGISQPTVDGLHPAGLAADTLRAGELVLGYRNEYDRYTSRPLLDRPLDPEGVLPLDEAGSGLADLGRNGTYLVLRQLQQHVRAFWDFVGQAAGPRPGTGSDVSGADGRIALAAKFVGRWPSGTPLALSPERDDAGLSRPNDFGYAELDADGERCPFGAHIRRANPRDALDPSVGAGESRAIVKRHRILRRGRLYGDVVPLDQLLDGDGGADGQERGLHFLCLCANLARQFEFIQHTWVNNSKFGGLYDDVDPIAGSPPNGGGTFTMQAKPVRRRVLAVPRFTTVRGGAYFFLPGLAALRHLARGPMSEGSRFRRVVNDTLVKLLLLERRVDPYFRDGFDRVLRPPIQCVVQALINLKRKPETLGLAEEQVLPDEAEVTRAIIEEMTRFTRDHYAHGHAERAGNTKTYGVVRGEFSVLGGLPDHLRHGVFATESTYRAWVRFAGPGPLAPADLDDNGVLSIGLKLMGVAGPKLLDDEELTQDFTGISSPTFTTPNVVENLKLQRQVSAGTPVLYFVDPCDSHYLDGIMQGLYARTHTNPLEVQYYSCVPYLLGEGQAVQYSIKPTGPATSRFPSHPGDNYLREAMAERLRAGDVHFDVLAQVQTDPRRMPIEDASVVWPEKLSPFVPVGRLRLPAQEFDSVEQLAFADNLSFNPWHSLAAHRPLGNQNRARRAIYTELSKLRQAMNGVPHVEPTGDEVFPPA